MDRRGGGWKSRAPLRPGCGLLAGPPCPAISGHRRCVLKGPGMAAPARRRIRIIMAALARRASLGASGSLPALTGSWRAAELPAPLPSRCAVLQCVRRRASQGRASDVAACGVRRFRGQGRTRVRVSSPTIMPREPKNCKPSTVLPVPVAPATRVLRPRGSQPCTISSSPGMQPRIPSRCRAHRAASRSSSSAGHRIHVGKVPDRLRLRRRVGNSRIRIGVARTRSASAKRGLAEITQTLQLVVEPMQLAPNCRNGLSVG